MARTRSMNGADLVGMERELLDLPRRIEEAAADLDREAWVSLSMRRDAIAEHVRRHRAEPVIAEIERLEAERERLEEAERRAMEEPPPEVPQHLKGTQTPGGMKQARVGQLARMGAEVGRELAQKRRELAAIEDRS